MVRNKGDGEILDNRSDICTAQPGHAESEMKHMRSLSGKKVAVVGMGLSGIAAARLLAQQKAKLDLQIAKERATAEEMAKKLEGIVCRLTAKVADEGRLYGSITVREIEEALATQGIIVEKRMILLKEPIKDIGTYKIPIRIYKDVEPKITLEVAAE